MGTRRRGTLWIASRFSGKQENIVFPMVLKVLSSMLPFVIDRNCGKWLFYNVFTRFRFGVPIWWKAGVAADPWACYMIVSDCKEREFINFTFVDRRNAVGM